MTKKDWFGIGYVSIWVVLWGSIASLIDYPLLQTEIYSIGSLGQVATFLISAIVSGIIGKWLFPIISNNAVIVSALGLDVDQTK